MVRGNSQPSFDPPIMVDGIHQEAVKTASETKTMGHERGMIKSNRAIERRATVPGFGMAQDDCRRVIEKAVSSLSHLFRRMLNLGERLTEVFQSLPAGD
jgi:hypothetical protein